MKSIKVKLDSLPIELFDYIRNYNSCKNIAFNRFAEGMKQKEIKQFINPKFIDLNSFIIQNAIIQAQALFQRHKTKKVIFGGKHLLNRYLKKLISKEEYRLQRESPMIISGETRCKGNRLFSFKASKSLLSELWKQKVEDAHLKDWKGLFSLIKNSALKYRVLIEDTKCIERFSLKHKKSKVDVIVYGGLCAS